jgi:hypothetical protein
MQEIDLKKSTGQLKNFLLFALVPWVAIGVMLGVMDSSAPIGFGVVFLLALAVLPFVALMFVLPVAKALGKSTFAWSLISIMIPAGYLLGGLALVLDAKERLSEKD